MHWSIEGNGGSDLPPSFMPPQLVTSLLVGFPDSSQPRTAAWLVVYCLVA